MTDIDHPKVFLIGNNDDWKADLRRGWPFLPWEHQETKVMAEADICFWWAEKRTITGFSGVQLGMSLAQAIPVKVGALNQTAVNWIDQQMGSLFLHASGMKVVFGKNVVDAYEHAMADIDVRMPTKFKVRAAVSGHCKGCFRTLRHGESVMSNGMNVQYHGDCYAQVFDKKNISTALFNASLIEALRKENAELEEKILRLALLHK
jgi:hypothetical protein